MVADGPALWACISSPLLNLLKQNQHGAFFQSYISDIEAHMAGIAFVDDTDLFDADSSRPKKKVQKSA